MQTIRTSNPRSLPFLKMYRAYFGEEGDNELYFVRGGKLEFLTYCKQLLREGKIVLPEGKTLSQVMETMVEEEVWHLTQSGELLSEEIWQGESHGSLGAGDWLDEFRLMEWLPSFYGGEDEPTTVIAFEWYSRTAYEIVRNYYFDRERTPDLATQLMEHWDEIASELHKPKPFATSSTLDTFGKGWD